MLQRLRRCRSVFDALAAHDSRGIKAALEPPEVPAAGAERDVARRRVLARYAAAAVEEESRLLSAPQLVELARELFVLRDCEAFTSVAATATAALDAADALEAGGGTSKRPSFADRPPASAPGRVPADDAPEAPVELVSGAAAPLRRELLLLETLERYLAWDEAAARDGATAAAARTDAAKADLRKARKDLKRVRRDRRKRENAAALAPDSAAAADTSPRASDGDEAAPSDAAGVEEGADDDTAAEARVDVLAEDVRALEAAGAAAAGDSLRVSPPGSSAPIPFERADAVAALLSASARGAVGGSTLVWRPDLLMDAAVFFWHKICVPVLEALEEKQQRGDDAAAASAATNSGARSDYFRRSRARVWVATPGCQVWGRSILRKGIEGRGEPAR